MSVERDETWSLLRCLTQLRLCALYRFQSVEDENARTVWCHYRNIVELGSMYGIHIRSNNLLPCLWMNALVCCTTDDPRKEGPCGHQEYLHSWESLIACWRGAGSNYTIINTFYTFSMIACAFAPSLWLSPDFSLPIAFSAAPVSFNANISPLIPCWCGIQYTSHSWTLNSSSASTYGNWYLMPCLFISWTWGRKHDLTS